MEHRLVRIELFKRAQVRVVAVSGPELDMSTAYGRGMADVLGSFDKMESDVKSERVAAAALQRAEMGNPNGAVPYGWTRVVETDERGRRTGARDVLDPDEMPVVKEICERLLAGESLHSVTAWLNDAGILPPGADFEFKKKARGLDNPDGTRWGKTTVKKLALRAQNCGMRYYHQGRPDERLLPMKAEPIISRDQWESLNSLLRSPERSRNNDGARKYLLSHTAVGRCGVCGGAAASLGVAPPHRRRRDPGVPHVHVFGPQRLRGPQPTEGGRVGGGACGREA